MAEVTPLHAYLIWHCAILLHSLGFTLMTAGGNVSAVNIIVVNQGASHSSSSPVAGIVGGVVGGIAGVLGE